MRVSREPNCPSCTHFCSSRHWPHPIHPLPVSIYSRLAPPAHPPHTHTLTQATRHVRSRKDERFFLAYGRDESEQKNQFLPTFISPQAPPFELINDVKSGQPVRRALRDVMEVWRAPLISHDISVFFVFSLVPFNESVIILCRNCCFLSGVF